MRRFFKNHFKSGLILLITAACLMAIVRIFPGDEKYNSSDRIKEAEKRLIVLHEEIKSVIDRIGRFRNEKEFYDFFSGGTFAKSSFSFYVLQNDSIEYWSDNEPAITGSQLSQIKDGDFLHLSNGDFLGYTMMNGARKIVGLNLLKHTYEYENKYLVNEFNPALGLGKEFAIAGSGDTLHLPGNNNHYILRYDSAYYAPSSYLMTWSYLIISILILFSIYLLVRHFSKSFLSTILFILVILSVRTLMIYFRMPEGLYAHEVFNPSNYASSFYFHSLGDMMLNVALFLALSIGFYLGSARRNKFLSVSIWVLSMAVIHFLIRGLVINSKISFELSSPSDINLYSILAFTAISILLLCFLFLTASMMKSFTNYVIRARHAWFAISICALYSAGILSLMNAEKEHEVRKQIAQKAEMSQDQVAEYLFRESEERIVNDTAISRIIHSGKTVGEDLASLLSQKYFSGYLSKFDLTVQEFAANDTSQSDFSLNYYLKKSQEGRATGSKRLFFLSSEAGGTFYLAILPLNEREHQHILVLTMTMRFLYSTTGFPELFMSGNRQDNSPSDEYSLARYTGHSLDYEFGNYVYPLTGKEFNQSNDEFVFIESNGYSHLVHRINSNAFIVVSKMKGTFVGVLTLFSWMFTFLSMLTFVIFVSAGFIGEGPEWQWNLTKRVQVSVIFLVVLAFILVGTGTVYYIKRKYVNDQRKSISDQVNALWFMIRDNSNSFVPADERDSVGRHSELDRLVSNTNIDFNIFGADGRMIYSSQPKIFDKGIVSQWMNPGAFFGIHEKGLTQYIHPENIGRLRFISAYAPFTDRSGNIVAFLNLPYFEKQNDLNREVSVFLSALVNIYVLLFALAVIVTIFISSRITKPLFLIRENMSRIRLGAINDKIAYKENDEIGHLVHEYNRMIEELSVSAEKLAKSERETAWREMAKQVAHEIKNPLTPMKLSVQHLHRTFKDKGYGEDQLVDRITSTLIQQIDTLSNIANAFSSFARMPQPVPVKTNLKEAIVQMASLYSEGIDIRVNSPQENFYVLIDNNQLTGIFSNLLKNAEQSIPPDRRGSVTISLGRSAGVITVEIADDGIGIPEDQMDKIFIPNFTTKSSGMGLGLAIVRNIVEEAGGKIWFSSVYGKGTSFFVSLPEAG